MSLAKFFGAYAERNIFIIYRADKVPIDPDGKPIDAQVEANRMTLAEAELWVLAGVGAGVGVVILPELRMFFVDLDHARNGAGWLPHVQNFLSRFPGAYSETSRSGEGVHVLGIYSGERPLHRVKNIDLGAELYSGGRYCALTGHGASGSVLTDGTEGLRGLIEQVFPPRDESEAAGGWTTAPVTAWEGPTDDEALLARAMQSTSANAAFGGRASFRDLWTGNVEVLARTYPSGNDAFDRSSADLALVNHLSFWTGSDCERMLRLMMREDCGLRREKWSRLDNYIRPTILRACADQTEWYKGGAAHVTPPPATPPAATVPIVSEGTMPMTAPGIPTPPSQALQLLPASQAPHILTYGNRNRVEATLPNLEHLLGKGDLVSLGFDTFFGQIVIAAPGSGQWRVLKDSDVTEFRLALERGRGFAPITPSMMRDVLDMIAKRNSYDSAQIWLNALVWDGVARIDNFLHVYCGAEDDEYTRAVSRYIWTGLPARVFEPGCQLDMVVAFQSKQGTRKSSGLQSLAPTPEYFTDNVSLAKDDADFKRMIRGKIVVEIAELAGLSKTEVEFIKRMITRKVEEWVEKWDKHTTAYARRCMLFASTNNKRFLPQDETGQRRWLPVEINQLDDVLITRDRAQLWAEGAQRWHARKNAGDHGVDWRDAERLAEGRHSRYEQTDVWETKIREWLDTPLEIPGQTLRPAPSTRPVATSEILESAIRMQAAQQDRKAANRAGVVMRALGYEYRTVRLPGSVKPVDRWIRKAGL